MNLDHIRILRGRRAAGPAPVAVGASPSRGVILLGIDGARPIALTTDTARALADELVDRCEAIETKKDENH